MRTITSHIVNPANDRIVITVMDAPGPGGANHLYSLAIDAAPNFGKLAYEAYFARAGGKSLVSGHPLPTWDQQAEGIQDAWHAAAVAVLEHTKRNPLLSFQNGPISEGVQAHDDGNDSCPLSDPETFANPATRGMPCTCPKKATGVNGITHEALLAVLIDRMEGFQAGPYANSFNNDALLHLGGAQLVLQARTKERMARGVEGTHKV